MMAILFLILTIAAICAYVKLRKASITLLVIGMAFTICILIHHMTDSLKVNL